MSAPRKTLWCLMTATLVTVGGGTLEAQNVNHPADGVGHRFYVYGDAASEDYLPTLFMPDSVAISQSTKCVENPHSGRFCYQAQYRIKSRPWSTVAFNSDGKPNPERAFNLFEKLEARRGDRIVVRFWARSPDAARVRFNVGNSLAFFAQTELLELGPSWKQYEIDLTGKDLSNLRVAFAWVMDRAHNDVEERSDRMQATVMLDNVYFIRLRAGHGG